ncbi:MAG: hypothetical protein H0T71_05390 [Acidobacteria bacterium]|nr:hypothetical protein [Acidobacteriota bacterium]
MTFVWEPIAAQPGVRRESATSVTLIAAAPDGEMYFRGSVPEDASAATATRHIEFEVPPGRLQLRMGVNGAGGPIDNDDREVVVPDLTGTDLAFGTPRLYVARTARDFQLIRKDATAVPTASREFRRTERLVVRPAVYAAGNATVTVTSKLLNKQGHRLADVAVTAAESGAPYLVDVPLAALAPGEYLLELTAATEGQKPITDLIAFRVEG